MTEAPRRRTTTRWVALALVPVALALTWGVGRLVTSANSRRAAPLLDAPVAPDPPQVDVGPVSQCGPPVTVRVTLVNISQTSSEVLEAIPDCGCTVPELPTPCVLAPGERREILVALDPWAHGGARTQQVVFPCRQPGKPRTLRISCTVVGALHTNPAAARRKEEPTVMVQVSHLEAPEGGAGAPAAQKPFEILGFDPPVVESWPRNPAMETWFSLDWALVDKAAESGAPGFERAPDGRWSRGVVVIRTSLEECPELRMRVYNSPAAARP